MLALALSRLASSPSSSSSPSPTTAMATTVPSSAPPPLSSQSSSSSSSSSAHQSHRVPAQRIMPLPDASTWRAFPQVQQPPPASRALLPRQPGDAHNAPKTSMIPAKRAKPDPKPPTSSFSRSTSDSALAMPDASLADGESSQPDALGPDAKMITMAQAQRMTFTDFKPDQFLERKDYSTEYPHHLNPPPGLTPLRCLFCDKKYGGQNARSMWRRHVSGKHDFLLSGGKSNNKRWKG